MHVVSPREKYALAQAMGLPPNDRTHAIVDHLDAAANHDSEWHEIMELPGARDVGYPSEVTKCIGGPLPTTFNENPPSADEIRKTHTQFAQFRAFYDKKHYDFLNVHGDDVVNEDDLEEADFGPHALEYGTHLTRLYDRVRDVPTPRSRTQASVSVKGFGTLTSAVCLGTGDALAGIASNRVWVLGLDIDFQPSRRGAQINGDHIVDVVEAFSQRVYNYWTNAGLAAKGVYQLTVLPGGVLCNVYTQAQVVAAESVLAIEKDAAQTFCVPLLHAFIQRMLADSAFKTYRLELQDALRKQPKVDIT